jgi:hypothetical protein
VLETIDSSPSFGGVHTVQLPKALEATYAIETLMLRPFGIDERDLEVDFSQHSRPALVTDILERCATVANGKSPDRSLLWELQVGTRIECLLRIISLGGAFEAALPMRCLDEACGKKVEVELSLDELLGSQGETSDSISVDCGEQTLELRKPRGLDQHAWSTREFESDRAAMESMVQTLVVQADHSRSENNTFSPFLFDDDVLSAIDRVMQESDSLVSFSLEVVCPYCQSHSELELDLETLSIEFLRHSQRSLLTTIHRLAKHYHWSEQQIFAVPHWRRIHYLRLLEEEEEERT